VSEKLIRRKRKREREKERKREREKERKRVRGSVSYRTLKNALVRQC
jgi:hypothetical protein